MIAQDVIDRAHAHAAAKAPLEMCGVVVGGRFRPISNLAVRSDRFRMDMGAYERLRREARIEAIVHSHTNDTPFASNGDRVMCDGLAIPWLIVSWPSRQHAWLTPRNGRALPERRPPGDSFSVVRDAFADYAGVELAALEQEAFARAELTAHLEANGFVLSPPGEGWRHGDIAVGEDHCGLFLAPDEIVRRRPGRGSERVVFPLADAKAMTRFRYAGPSS